MKRASTRIGSAILCALAVGAVSAAGASAAGTTAFTCVAGEGTLDSHCDPGSSGTSGHVEITAGETTELHVAATTGQVLKGTLAGVEVELEGQEVEVKPTTTASIVNNDESPMNFSGLVTLSYTEVKVLKPAGLGCTVENETVDTEPLKFESITGTGAKSTGIKVEPVTGTAFAVVHIQNCIVAGNFKVTGRWTINPSGATWSYSPESEELKFGGSEATLTGTPTVTAKAPSDTSFSPLSPTTAEPPPTVKGITAYECAKDAGNKDFSDAHCDEAVAAGTGEYGHASISVGRSTEIEATNEATEHDTTDSADAVLEAKVAGVETKIRATKVRASGQLENFEPEEAVAAVEGWLTTEYTKLHVEEPTGCELEEPIRFTSAFESVEEGADMGLEFKPAEGTTLLDLSFEGEECPLAGITAHVKGTATATGGAGGAAKGSGATEVFEPAHESLAIGSSPVSLNSTLTMKTREGSPIALTTVE